MEIDYLFCFDYEARKMIIYEILPTYIQELVTIPNTYGT